jgi:oligosaccharide repeat unit polymerase
MKIKKNLLIMVPACIIICILVGIYTKIEAINLVIVSAIILYCLIKGLNEKSLLNPYFLFVFTPISLLLYNPAISDHYLVELKQSTYNLAFYNMVLFLVGIQVCRKIKINKTILRYDLEDNNKANKFHLNMFLIIGMIPIVYGLITVHTLDFRILKAAIDSMSYSSIIGFFRFPALVFALENKNKTKRNIVVLILIGSMLLHFSKNELVMFLLTALLVIMQKKQKKGITSNIKKYLLIGGSVAALLISFNLYNSVRFDTDILEYMDNLGYISQGNKYMYLPIMYFISPWSNLQNIMETVHEHTNGLWLIKPFISYLQLDRLLGLNYELIPRFIAFNTYTYISVLFIDFGFIGSGILSILIGIYISYLYKLYFKYGGPFTTAVYAFVGYATLMMFFNNHFLQLSYPITIYLIIVLYLVLFKQRSRKHIMAVNSERN